MATPRTLDQILSELRPTFDPQVQSLQERAGLIPQQIEAEEKGLQAKQTQAFGDILGGARRRGLGFSGIPLGEQAQYTASEFLPAMARLRQSGQERTMSLQDAILGINERRDTLAQQIRQREVDMDFQRQQAEAQRAFEAQQAELNRRAQRAAAGSAFSPSLGAMGGAPLQGGGQSPIAPGLQNLFNQVFIRQDGTKWGDNELKSDYARTAISAGYGNLRDKQKLQLYHSVRPDLFGNGINANSLGNGGKLRF